jgi:hypothetical protein
MCVTIAGIVAMRSLKDVIGVPARAISAGVPRDHPIHNRTTEPLLKSNSMNVVLATLVVDVPVPVLRLSKLPQPALVGISRRRSGNANHLKENAHDPFSSAAFRRSRSRYQSAFAKSCS